MYRYRRLIYIWTIHLISSSAETELKNMGTIDRQTFPNAWEGNRAQLSHTDRVRRSFSVSNRNSENAARFRFASNRTKKFKRNRRTLTQLNLRHRCIGSDLPPIFLHSAPPYVRRYHGQRPASHLSTEWSDNKNDKK